MTTQDETYFKRLSKPAVTLIPLMFSTLLYADHTVQPTAIALVGDLQTELGCSGDWQPECSATELIQQGDLWQASFLVPAGSWQYKVAINDSWDESYGDNGNNVTLELAEATEVTFTYQQGTHTVSDNAPVVVIQPDVVTLVGDLQSEVGCPADWQPACQQSRLVLDDTDMIWQGSFELQAGHWLFKTAINQSWDENYGANGQANGSNIELTLGQTSLVKFYYDHASHWITNDKNSVIATIAGNFQQQLGCPGNWQPDCLRSWLKDVDGDGIYHFTTTALTAGSYEAKVAYNESWQENYGENGQQNGANIRFNVLTDNDPVEFSYDPSSHLLTIGGNQFDANLSEAKAYWLSEDTIAWDVADVNVVELHYSEQAQLGLSLTEGLTGGDKITLTADGVVDGQLADKFRHLTGLPTFKVQPEDISKIPAILKSQFAVYAKTGENEPAFATGIQPPGVLDDLYTFSGQLGVMFDEGIPTIRLWAPTAKQVKLHLYDYADLASEPSIYLMDENTDSGTWSVVGSPDWHGKYYKFEVEVYTRATGKIEHNLVTDPYSVSLSINSQFSQIIDLNANELKPVAWNNLHKPALNAPEDQAIYELHVRDFSINDPEVPDAYKGTFKAFTVNGLGMKHLAKLARSGLTSVHLLPAFDCATINEDTSEQLTVSDLSLYGPDSQQQQQAIEAIRTQDGFNWCYDPYHYTVPEGSYATQPNSALRIKEFRQMVAALNRAGLRVIMDVVYNHTSGSLQGEKSVLDKIVPDYYHRLNSTGGIEMSSCCANTASEHNMMEKLMLDSLKTWATAYKVDGFRFDLMGHHSKQNILKAQTMLQSLTVENDGVDGKDIYLYGEGWNFGEVVNNTRFEQASQYNMGQNTGVGAFNDHIRDAVRGGGPFDSGIDHVARQGFINGLYYDANDESNASLDDLLWISDKVRMALAGTLSDFVFENYQGQLISTSSLGGYASDPQESINYIAAHDNETLFDANQYKLPVSTSAADRARVQNLGNAIVALAQGVPFFHAGQEMMRSKSMDRNSYDAGDWFNVLDFSYQTNGWGRGLPLKSDNEQNWQVITPLLANPELAITSNNIVSVTNNIQAMLKIRQSSPLYRLQTAEEIRNKLHFHNTGRDQIPGLIVMSLTGSEQIEQMVLINVTTQAQQYTMESLTGYSFNLHPALQGAKDPIVKQSTFAKKEGEFTVPARTVAVFVNQRDIKNARKY
ncbi:pullulanase-type alpha-1,6-glucosidase [Thalassotalea sp. G2M2-11]|uniref:pullulanase-type alpha-1,6-glucosidase n=1 Tax=Thalassotalea sp. G2M2-11 TaxID=2787627 RepID=UPI0019CFE759|nr:pullulanase-type alpha-1,6-glucosidase [Thalassotalea sp. G2M2-11]